MAITPDHRDAEARFRQLLVDADLPSPDTVEYEERSVGFFWNDQKLVVFVDLDEPPGGMDERLTEFLATGAVDGVAVGTARDDVRAALGEPEDVSAIRPEIWKYGPLQVTYHDGAVSMISLHDLDIDTEACERALTERGLTVVDEPLLPDARRVVQSRVVLSTDEGRLVKATAI